MSETFSLPLLSSLEAILFVSARSWSRKTLAGVLGIDQEALGSLITEYSAHLDDSQSALQVVTHGQEVELVTRGEYAALLREVFAKEASGELSRPSLETLAILAYRGPLTRPEIEQIRGVQSSIILRNLTLRGLIEFGQEERLGQATYQVTVDFLKHLGLTSLEGLPDYQGLRHAPVIEQLLHEGDVIEATEQTQ